jgi:hypothetical protein
MRTTDRTADELGALVSTMRLTMPPQRVVALVQVRLFHGNQLKLTHELSRFCAHKHRSTPSSAQSFNCGLAYAGRLPKADAMHALYPVGDFVTLCIPRDHVVVDKIHLSSPFSCYGMSE